MAYPVAPWGADEVWNRDRGLVLQSQQRHLLQLAFVDRLLGQLVRRLHETGLWDRSLLVVTADHGIAFQPGEKRRPVWPENLDEIAYVPLFVKLPHEAGGRIDDRHVQTIDVVPTIAGALGVRIPWPVDGVAAGRAPEPTRADVRKGSGREVSAPLAELNRRRYATVARRLALFGDHTPAARLFGVGSYRDSLGLRPDTSEFGAARGVKVVLDGGRSPLEVSGRLVGDGAAGIHDAGVVSGGRIVAVVPVYAARLWALVPDAGAARHVQLVAISGRTASPRFARLSVSG
jgi:hypothetical protein